jgi:hypothetical protein
MTSIFCYSRRPEKSRIHSKTNYGTCMNINCEPSIFHDGGRSNRMLCDSCSVWGVGSIVNNLPLLFVSLDPLVLTRLAVWATKPNRYSPRVSKIIQLFWDKFVDYLYRID